MLWLMFFFHFHSQYSIPMTKQGGSFNAGGHSLVNLLVKMLLFLSVSLKQVARTYPYSSETVCCASLLHAVVRVRIKFGLSSIRCNKTALVLSSIFTLYYSFCTMCVKCSILSFIYLAAMRWNWKRLMCTDYRIYPVVRLALVSLYS